MRSDPIAIDEAGCQGTRNQITNPRQTGGIRIRQTEKNVSMRNVSFVPSRAGLS